MNLSRVLPDGRVIEYMSGTVVMTTDEYIIADVVLALDGELITQRVRLGKGDDNTVTEVQSNG